jgi:shikimate kinase
MPGAGKSTFGKKLAEATGINFFDLDDEIEKMTGVSIPKIFAEAGEEEFRILETYCLGMLIKLDEPSLIATGGGTPCFMDNMDTMNESGVTIYINTPMETVIERVSAKKHKRPLVQNMEDDEIYNSMMEMYENRRADYEKAQIITEADVDKVVAMLNQ